MIQKKPKQSEPSPKEIYDSAWAAITEDMKRDDVESLRAEGWRSALDFPINRRCLAEKMAKDTRIETRKFKVFTGGRYREMNFYRPRV